MKIALFQNFLDTIGGAEVVGLNLARELDADIYTTNVDREKIKAMGFEDVRIHSIGKVPTNAPFRQQMILWRFSRLNLAKLGKKYDFYIINGDWSVSAAMHHSPNMWYVNATIREIWDLREYVRKNNVAKMRRPIFDMWVIYNRYLNKKYIGRINSIAANSTFTRDRVKKYLNRDSEVIYPPIRTKQFYYGKDGGYWLSVNRLIAYKRVDMQLRAFAKMPDKKLVILGPHEDANHTIDYVNLIRKTKPDNVTILYDGAASFNELVEYYANCTGFITSCHMEDFGMTAVEAMASGKPVIAPNEGGYRESVKNGETGVLVDNLDEDNLAETVKKVSAELAQNPDKYRKASIKRAAKFDVSVFISQIKSLLQVTIERRAKTAKQKSADDHANPN